MTDTTIVDPAGQPLKPTPAPEPPPEPAPPGHVVTSTVPVQAPVEIKASQPGGSVGTTAIAALSGAGAGDTIMWIFECFQKGQVVTPETDLATIWGAALMPIGHALYQMILQRLTPKT